ncbi:MAG: hypothetical protein AB1894_15890 [Chloroflexota bacterium]
MIKEILESKLTPAAEEVLDELIKDYRLQLLKEANKSASDITGEVREISVRDILDALQKMESFGTSKRAKFIERLFIMYAFLGMIMSLIGYIMNQFLLLPSYLPEILSLVGALLALFSLSAYYLNTKRVVSFDSLLSSKRDSTSDTNDYSMLFISKWRDIEILSREVISYLIGESNVGNMPIRDLLNNLLKFQIISQSDSKLYLKLLDKRNSLVHSKTVELSASEYSELESIADLIIKKLYNIKKGATSDP